MGIGIDLLPSLFVYFTSKVTPSLLHRYSIASPSFRWSIDGITMEMLWTYGEGIGGSEGGDSDQDELKDKSRYSNTRLKKCFDNTDKCYYL